MKRPIVTMFIGKLSYGIASAFIMLAGMVKMPLTTFFKYGIIVAVAEYGSLLYLGYFLGNSFGGEATYVLNHVQYVIAIVAVFIAGYYLFSSYMRSRLMKGNKEIEDRSV
jgi:membrane protein DedA with SNARE-associated domain